MIKLTRLDNREFYLNCDLIEFFEANPDTIVTLRSEKKIIVKESADEVLKRIIEYKQTVYTNPFSKKGKRIMLNSENNFFEDKDLRSGKNIQDIKDIGHFDNLNEDDEYYYEDDE